mmetsp:Transcript_21456/g.40352  ORF Transcript_21456/g.40352 Transcript_21456/m.40352 type:complete len:275 (-) Transcript_21456:3313-4137(-)
MRESASCLTRALSASLATAHSLLHASSRPTVSASMSSLSAIRDSTVLVSSSTISSCSRCCCSRSASNRLEGSTEEAPSSSSSVTDLGIAIAFIKLFESSFFLNSGLSLARLLSAVTLLETLSSPVTLPDSTREVRFSTLLSSCSFSFARLSARWLSSSAVRSASLSCSRLRRFSSSASSIFFLTNDFSFSTSASSSDTLLCLPSRAPSAVSFTFSTASSRSFSRSDMAAAASAIQESLLTAFSFNVAISASSSPMLSAEAFIHSSALEAFSFSI